jgi:5'(3')-deoxyribonucleotidase
LTQKARKRIAVDMDEVLADTLSEHIARYNLEHGEGVTKSDLGGKWIWDIVSADRHQRLTDYLHAEDFFEDLAVVPDSQDVLKALSDRYDIYIATAAMEFPNSFGPKYRWLQRHFPFISPANYIFCGDKGIVRAHYLIDDLPRNFRRFVGQGILFTAPHNLGVSGYHRVDNWRQVADFFRDPDEHNPDPNN